MHMCFNLWALTSHLYLAHLPALPCMSPSRKALMRYNWNLGDAVVISSLFEVSVFWVSVHSLWFELFFFPLFGPFNFGI